MKCVRFPNGDIIRITDQTANFLVRPNDPTCKYKYASKTQWREQGKKR